MASVHVDLTVNFDAELEDGTFDEFRCRKKFSMPFCPRIGLRVQVTGMKDYAEICGVVWNLKRGLVECFARVPGSDMPLYDREKWHELKTELLKSGWKPPRRAKALRLRLPSRQPR